MNSNREPLSLSPESIEFMLVNDLTVKLSFSGFVLRYERYRSLGAKEPGFGLIKEGR